MNNRSHRSTAVESCLHRQLHVLYGSSFADDGDDDDDDDDDDEYIDTESLGDWRNFRRSLAITDNDDDNEDVLTMKDDDDLSTTTAALDREVTENEKVLEKQNKGLAEEYASVWAHVTATVRTIRMKTIISLCLVLSCLALFSLSISLSHTPSH